MKAIVIDKFVKEYDEIKISEVPKPQPKKDEVVVQVAAAGVNFVDLLYARGKHQNNHRNLVSPPFTLGLEFAGTILSFPSFPSSPYKPGDRVFGGTLGTYSQQISVPESSLHRIPTNWSFTAAAGLAATAPVSYGALIIRGKLKKGEKVLIHAAAGGLGLMAIQIAKAFGAYVFATAGSQEKLSIAKKHGADEIINYNQEKWWEEVLKKCKGGVDVVFDSVGLVDGSLKCLRRKGRVVIVGFAGREGDVEKIGMNRVLLREGVLIGYRFGETDRRDPAETKEIWKGLNILIEKGLIRPTVFEKEYKGLERVVIAMKDLSQRKVWGKAVVLIEGEEGEKARL